MSESCRLVGQGNYLEVHEFNILKIISEVLIFDFAPRLLEELAYKS